ncbi:hypothetical protein GCM10010448_14720 [Streptomyces glomeratus]|uniref:Restriction endonuclease domain-containing protein n=1 Tax=Streptomyces glomeratus TaxID=284452 RepID=A0ABP6L8H3_9ACTN
MIGTSPGRSARTACQDKYQLVTRSDGTATALWRDQERSETIPFGIADFKLIPVSVLPPGREIVRSEEPFTARRRAGRPTPPDPCPARAGRPPDCRRRLVPGSGGRGCPQAARLSVAPCIMNP